MAFLVCQISTRLNLGIWEKIQANITKNDWRNGSRANCKNVIPMMNVEQLKFQVPMHWNRAFKLCVINLCTFSIDVVVYFVS